MVSAKSGTSFERETRSKRGMTLLGICQRFVYLKGSRSVYLMNPTSNQTRPSVHPIVLSPRILFQSKMRLRENFWPATSAVNRIRTIAVT